MLKFTIHPTLPYSSLLPFFGPEKRKKMYYFSQDMYHFTSSFLFSMVIVIYSKSILLLNRFLNFLKLKLNCTHLRNFFAHIRCVSGSLKVLCGTIILYVKKKLIFYYIILFSNKCIFNRWLTLIRSDRWSEGTFDNDELARCS